jgi:hypothetical protein
VQWQGDGFAEIDLPLTDFFDDLNIVLF